MLSEEVNEDIAGLLAGYTRITSRRRTEAMNDRIYAPFIYGECEELIKETDELMKKAQVLSGKLSSDAAPLFYELVYVPLCGNLNIQQMWALTTMNHAYAGIGSTIANSLADEIRARLKTDRKLVEKLHGVSKGKWYGMGLSEHIGFTNWCDEECRGPVIHTIEPADKPRLIALIPETGEHTEGGFWSGRTLTLASCLDPLVCGGYVELSTASAGKVSYSVSAQDDFIDIMEPGKSVKGGKSRSIFIFVDRMKLAERESACGRVVISYDGGIINIDVPVNNPKLSEDLPENTFIYCAGENTDLTKYISIAPSDYTKKNDTDAGGFEVINGLGRSGAAIKAYPQNTVFARLNSPTVTYSVLVPEGGKYNVRVYTTCANPAKPGGNIIFTLAANGSSPVDVNMIPDDFAVGDGQKSWEQGVLDNVRVKDTAVELSKGLNEIKIGAITPGFVLEKIVITPEGVTLPYSYLGPQESFHTTKD
jgi:hypothetical protein